MSSSSKLAPSRFSSLKVFKLPGSNNPPPVPEKDHYISYAQPNHSWVSLSPNHYDTSQPTTPLSLQHAIPSSTPPNSSTVSSVPSPHSPSSSSFTKGLFKLAKRSLIPKSPTQPSNDVDPTCNAPDDGISLPWNVQHNIHVDEGYNGLPPSWSAALVDVGYSEDEIEVIQSRRAVPRTHSSVDRLPGPSSHSIHSVSTTNHVPFTTAIRRQISQISFRKQKPAARTSSDTSPSYHNSTTSNHSDVSSSPPPLPTSPPLPVDGHATRKSIDGSSQNSRTRSKSQPGPSTHQNSDKGRGITLLKRPFRVINGSPVSPPPAYLSPEKTVFVDHSDEETSSVRSRSIDTRPSNEIVQKELPSVPPRLSLGSDGFADITSWTESLFSSVSDSSGTDSVDALPNTPPNTGSSWTMLSPVRSFESLHKPVATSPLKSSFSIDTSASSSPQNTSDVSGSEQDSPTSPVGPSSISQILGSSAADVHPDDYARGRENRDSDMSTVTVRNATIVTGVELATRARANVVASSMAGQAHNQKLNPASIYKDATPRQSGVDGIVKSSADEDEASMVILDKTPSPTSSTHSSSAASSLSSIAMPSSMSSGSKQRATSVLIRGASKWEGEEQAVDVPEISPSPLDSKFIVEQPTRIASFVDSQDEDDDPMIASSPRTSGLGDRRLSIQADEVEPTLISGSSMNGDMLSSLVPSLTTPSPAPRYPGWVSEVLAPLYGFIDEDVDPNDRFQDKKEIAEGESGLVYQARDLHARAMPPLAGNGEGSGADLVAIKTVDILPSGSAKLMDLKNELEIMMDVKHVNVLTMDGLYVDLLEDSLWIKMELMERSLADVIALAQEGVVIQEQVAAKFASDVVLALIYLQKLGIAHRDIRSDNLLLSKDGVLKIADFSNAVKVSAESPLCSGVVGVLFWQAPEVRTGSYDPLKADIWSLGATVWEMAQAEPPFNGAKGPSDLQNRWPALKNADILSRSFHEFLYLCSHPASLRPGPEALLTTPFIRSAVRRSAVTQLLARCKTAEEDLRRRESTDSQGTISR